MSFAPAHSLTFSFYSAATRSVPRFTDTLSKILQPSLTFLVKYCLICVDHSPNISLNITVAIHKKRPTIHLDNIAEIHSKQCFKSLSCGISSCGRGVGSSLFPECTCDPNLDTAMPLAFWRFFRREKNTTEKDFHQFLQGTHSQPGYP